VHPWKVLENLKEEAGNRLADVVVKNKQPENVPPKLVALVTFVNNPEGTLVNEALVQFAKQFVKLIAFVQFVKLPAFKLAEVRVVQFAKQLARVKAEAGNNPEGTTRAPACESASVKFVAFVQFINNAGIVVNALQFKKVESNLIAFVQFVKVLAFKLAEVNPQPANVFVKFKELVGNNPEGVVVIFVQALKQDAKLVALVTFVNNPEGTLVNEALLQLWKVLVKLIAFVQFVKVPAFKLAEVRPVQLWKVLVKFVAEAGNNPEGTVKPAAVQFWKVPVKF